MLQQESYAFLIRQDTREGNSLLTAKPKILPYIFQVIWERWAKLKKPRETIIFKTKEASIVSIVQPPPF